MGAARITELAPFTLPASPPPRPFDATASPTPADPDRAVNSTDVLLGRYKVRERLTIVGQHDGQVDRDEPPFTARSPNGQRWPSQPRAHSREEQV
jgi:hypothetical protein